MVKGISRQVIMVRPPDTALFDQAIFILKDKGTEDGGVSEEEILQQAQRAAEQYLRTRTSGGRALGLRLRPVLHTLLGAAAASALWTAAVILL